MTHPQLDPTGSSLSAKNALVQKLEVAMQKLRQDRDQEYHDLIESKERARLASEELQVLQKIVADLKAKRDKLVQDKDNVQSSIAPLEQELRDITAKVSFCFDC